MVVCFGGKIFNLFCVTASFSAEKAWPEILEFGTRSDDIESRWKLKRQRWIQWRRTIAHCCWFGLGALLPFICRVGGQAPFRFMGIIDLGRVCDIHQKLFQAAAGTSVLLQSTSGLPVCLHGVQSTWAESVLEPSSPFCNRRSEKLLTCLAEGKSRQDRKFVWSCSTPVGVEMHLAFTTLLQAGSNSQGKKNVSFVVVLILSEMFCFARTYKCPMPHTQSAVRMWNVQN